MINLLSAKWWKKATLEDVKNEIGKCQDINVRDDKGNSPLIMAILHTDNYEIINELIRAKADVNAKNWIIGSVLAVAAKHSKSPRIIELLINSGADVNEENILFETTPLMYAMENTCSEIAQILIKNGANINATDCQGKSVLEYAVNETNKEFLNNIINEKTKQPYLNLSDKCWQNSYGEDFLQIYIDNEKYEKEEIVAKILSYVSPREERLLRLWFGLDKKAQTIQQIAVDFNVTSERVGQILSKALKNLQNKKVHNQIKNIITNTGKPIDKFICLLQLLNRNS